MYSDSLNLIAMLVTGSATVVMAVATCLVGYFNRRLAVHTERSWTYTELKDRLSNTQSIYTFVQKAKVDILYLQHHFAGQKNTNPYSDHSFLKMCFDPNDRYPEAIVGRELRGENQQNRITINDCEMLYADLAKLEANAMYITASPDLYNRLLDALAELATALVIDVNGIRNALDNLLDEAVKETIR